MSGWDFQQDLCRCCHATGKFLALSTGLTDDLSCAAVLQTYMDINISPIPGVLSEITYRICNNCYIRLKDASEFKNQVQQCEEKFKDMFSDMNVVKIEVDPVEDDIIQEFHDDVDMQSNDGDVKEEVDKKACKMTKVKSESSKKKANSDSDDDGWSDDDDDIIKPLTFEEPPKLKLSDLPKSFSEDKKQRLLNCIDEVTNTNMTIVDAAKKYGINNNVLWYWVNKQKNKNNKKKKTYPKASTSEAADTVLSSLKCKECFRDFDSQKILNKHFKISHINSKGDCIEECGKNLKNAQSHTVRHHIKMHHTNFKCSECPLWSSYYDIMIHRDDKHGVPIPTCGACGFKTHKKHKLLIHQRKVHLMEKNVTCKLCGMKFFNKNDLKRHTIRHNPKNVFQCKYCKKTFPRSRALNLHEKIHTGQKNKVCDVCGEKFVQKASLNYHMKKHHPETKY